MPNPTVEFTHSSSFTLVSPLRSTEEASYRLLSEDVSTGDKTLILIRPPGQESEGESGEACVLGGNQIV